MKIERLLSLVQEYMQGWYSQYCNKTGQFCDQVKLKHSTKDGQTGKEIIYNVDSSSGYVPTSSPESNQDDINISYLLSQTTTNKPTSRQRQFEFYGTAALVG